MTNVPFNQSFMSAKIAKKLVAEATENYMRKIVEFQELPATIKAFEEWFEANGYTYQSPMTNADFKAMATKQLGVEKSVDPIEVNNLAEKLKTGYTNHYLEYKNKIKSLEKVDETADLYERQIKFMESLKPTLLQRFLKLFS